MSITLKNIALQISSKIKDGDIISRGLTQAASEIDRVDGLITPLTAPITGFIQTQSGVLGIDVLSVRNLTARFDLEDCPDIQYFSTAGYRVPLLGRWMRLNNTSGASVTLTSTPTISTSFLNGQVLELFNVSAQNIVFQDNGTLAGSKLRLQAATRTLKQGGSLLLRGNTDLGFWYERAFSSPV